MNGEMRKPPLVDNIRQRQTPRQTHKICTESSMAHVHAAQQESNSSKTIAIVKPVRPTVCIQLAYALSIWKFNTIRHETQIFENLSVWLDLKLSVGFFFHSLMLSLRHTDARKRLYSIDCPTSLRSSNKNHKRKMQWNATDDGHTVHRYRLHSIIFFPQNKLFSIQTTKS